MLESAREERCGDAGASEVAVQLGALFAETVALFHRLRVAAEQLHGQGAVTASRRAILFELHRSGPQTVPQMARARPVSRQFIQSLVDQLGADGLVEFIDNPAHKRSRLVRLSADGRGLVEAMQRRELALLSRLPLAELSGDPVGAASVLRSVRELLERPAVQRLLAAASDETPRAAPPADEGLLRAGDQ